MSLRRGLIQAVVLAMATSAAVVSVALTPPTFSATGCAVQLIDRSRASNEGNDTSELTLHWNGATSKGCTRLSRLGRSCSQTQVTFRDLGVIGVS